MKKNLRNMNIFVGKDAILRYLNPAEHAPASLVELPTEFIFAETSFSKKDRLRIFLKMASEWATNSVKMAPVYHWFEMQKKKGNLTKDTVVVIPSSGGAGLACVVVGRRFGVHVEVIMPKDAPQTKKDLIQLANGKPAIFSPETPGKTAVELAKKMGKLRHHIVFRQYEDNTNTDGHKLMTIAQIWDQMEAAGIPISGIVAGTGTGGTGNAAYEFLEEREAKAVAVRIVCAEENPLPGMRALSRLRPKQVPLFHEHQFLREEVERRPAFRLSVSLFRNVGLKVGMTTGGALGGLFNVLQKAKHLDPSAWGGFLNSQGERTFVVVNGDLLDLYLPQLSTVLNADGM